MTDRRTSEDQRWSDNAEHLASYIREHQHQPSKIDKDPVVAVLGMWVGSQRRALSKGLLRPDRKEVLDSSCPGWRGRAAQQELFTAVAAEYFAEHGSYPSTVGGRGKITRAGVWLRRQRDAATAGRLTADQIAELDEQLPGWQEPAPIRKFEESVPLAAAWILEHDRTPSQTSEDPEEKRLGTFLRNQVNFDRRGELSAEKRATLDHDVPRWQELPSARGWERTADAVIAYANKHGRTPPAGGGPDEAGRLGKWVTAQRRLRSDGQMEADRAEYLDRKLPWWRTGTPDQTAASLGVKWSERAAQVAQTVAGAGGIPTVDSPDPVLANAASWLAKQRSHFKHGRLDPARATQLDQLVPAWREKPSNVVTTHARMWTDKADAIVAFGRKHETMPDAGSDDPSEAKLGRWLDQQRAAARNGSMREERASYLEERIDWWRSGVPGITGSDISPTWAARAQDLKRWFEVHGRIPSAGAAGQDAARIGRWVTTQRIARRNGTLGADRIAWLDRVTPGWDGPPRRNRRPTSTELWGQDRTASWTRTLYTEPTDEWVQEQVEEIRVRALPNTLYRLFRDQFPDVDVDEYDLG